MFKSKARKQAEFLLKVEREKERLQEREAAREAARQKAAEDIQNLIKACVNGYKTAYQRYPKATIVSTIVGGLLVLGIGGIRNNTNTPPQTPISLRAETLEPKSTPVVKATPEPTYEQVAAIAYGEDCQERLRGMYSFDSPEIAARRIYYGWGYTREKIKDLALDDLTKLTAYQLGTGQSEAQVVSELTKEYDNDTFAKIVVGAAKHEYMPQYMKNAQRECKDLALSKPQSQVSIDAQTTPDWATLHSNDGKINLRTGAGTVNKAIGYGINGDRVQVLDSGQDSGGYYWYKVHFPNSGATGWVAAQLLEIDQ